MCARIDCDAALYRQIAQAAAQVIEWEVVPTHAEAHGVAPLFYRHLTAAGVTLPRAVKRELQASAVRHRLANQVHTRVLRDIVTRYQAAGIRVLALKGIALCHLLYPEPGLRPMGDLDLLVSEKDAARAQSLLSELGFSAPLPADGQRVEHRHLGQAIAQVEGFIVSVEIHHHLFERGVSPILMGIDDLTSAPLAFPLPPGDLTAQTLGYEDTLWYQCQHLVGDTTVFSATKLIWVADIVSFAERFVAAIDWARIKKQYPLVLSTLSLLHFLTPLSDRLLARASIAIGSAPPGMWDDFAKSPRTILDDQMNRGYGQTWRAAFSPSEWWLRLRYGLGSASPLPRFLRARHALYLAGRLNNALRRRWRR